MITQKEVGELFELRQAQVRSKRLRDDIVRRLEQGEALEAGMYEAELRMLVQRPFRQDAVRRALGEAKFGWLRDQLPEVEVCRLYIMKSSEGAAALLPARRPHEP